MGGNVLVNKLWPLFYKRAELDFRLTKEFTNLLKEDNVDILFLTETERFVNCETDIIIDGFKIIFHL